MTDALFARQLRLTRVRSAMLDAGIDTLLLSLGADLPWITGYHAMPLERLTMLVLPIDDVPTLVVPGMEAARVEQIPELFNMRPWGETESPVKIVADLVGKRKNLGISDRSWSTFLLDLQTLLPQATWRQASRVTGRLRAIKDVAEIEALQNAATAVDIIAAELQNGDIPLIGRTEAEVSADISARILSQGHEVVNFAIVAAGENAASPHHEPGRRIIRAGEVVLCDFGGTMADYCSDITRCVYTGEPPAEFADLYETLMASQAAGVAAGTVGTPCEAVDQASRRVIDEAGLGQYFIHRTGHGIGMEAHEDPYMVSGNTEELLAGHAYSVEPGIYVSGRWGARLEDIVVATADGPVALNSADHRLMVVEA